MNMLSLSDTIVFGIPWSQHTSNIKVEAAVDAEKYYFIAMKWAYFVKRSTMTMMVDFHWILGNSTIKSIVMPSQAIAGIGRGWSRPVGAKSWLANGTSLDKIHNILFHFNPIEMSSQIVQCLHDASMPSHSATLIIINWLSLESWVNYNHNSSFLFYNTLYHKVIMVYGVSLHFGFYLLHLRRSNSLISNMFKKRSYWWCNCHENFRLLSVAFPLPVIFIYPW